MGIAAHIVTSVTATVMAIMPASCSKITGHAGAASKTAPKTLAKTAPTAPTTASTSTPVTKTRDLGELSLTNNYELQVVVARDRTCVIVPKILDSKNLQLTMSLQTRSASGKMQDLSVTQVTGPMGKPVEVAVGDMDLTLTPMIAP